jgi:glycosyltransferase 2 family protein
MQSNKAMVAVACTGRDQSPFPFDAGPGMRAAPASVRLSRLATAGIEQPPKARQSAWRGLAFLIKLLVTVGLLAILLERTPLHGIGARVRAMDVASLAAAVALLFSISLTTAVRWKVILQHFGARAGLAGLWRYTLIGGFFNQILPSGVGGDLFRIWYARKRNASAREAVGSVVVDRMLGLVALTAIAIVGAPFVLWRSGAPLMLVAPLAAIGAVLAASAAFLSLDRLEPLLTAALRRISFGRAPLWSHRMLQAGAWAARSTRLMLMAWPEGAITLGISLANQLLTGYVAFLLLAGMGDSVGLGWVLVLFPAVLLVSVLPISLGGWGVRESAMVIVFALVGVPADAALSASILYGVCLLAASLPGAAVWVTERRHPGRVSGNHARS